MRSVYLVLALVVTASQVAAEGIRWKPEMFANGDYVSIKQSKGGLIHHVFRGKEGRSYVIESYRGASPKGQPVFTTFLDKNGNQTRWRRQDGFQLTFKPHDCTRTLGRCQYTQTGSDGKKERRVRVTTSIPGGFRFDEYNAKGDHLFGGQFALDQRGNAGEGRISGQHGAQVFRLVRQVYQ